MRVFVSDAASRLTPLGARSAPAPPQGGSGESVAALGQDSAPRRALRARSCQRAVGWAKPTVIPRGQRSVAHPTPLRGRRAEKRKPMVVRISNFGRRGGRLPARHMRSLKRASRSLSARRSVGTPSACSFCGDLANTGPRFRLDIALKARGRSRNIRSSASSWQGLVVVPGGAPVPPECPCRVHEPAGRRTPSRCP